MSLQIRAYSTADIPQLQVLADQVLSPFPEPTLATDLGDALHDGGRKGCVIWRDDQPVAFCGWIDIGVPQDGCFFGAPFIASDLVAAELMVDRLQTEAKHAGARALRVTVRPPESAKRSAVLAAGFSLFSEFLHLRLPLPMQGDAALPDTLRRVDPACIDWVALQDCFVDTFSAVPNAPAMSAEMMAHEWGKADWSAGQVLVDTDGRYQAFCLVDEQMIQAVGVRQAWRGRNIAPALYQHAASRLHAAGVEVLRSMVASVNQPSLRLHQKLGFTEYKPRWQTFELSL